MRLTDVENFARRLPTRANLLRVIEPEALLEFAVVVLDPPADLRQLPDRRIAGRSTTSAASAKQYSPRAREG
jgi:hypothetical protein